MSLIYPSFMTAEEHKNDSEVVLRISRRMNRHEASVRSILHIGDPHNIIVSAAGEKRILVWNAETFKMIGIINCHNKPVRHVIQWDENIILSCDQISCIFANTISKPHKVVSKMQILGMMGSVDKVIFKLLKLDDHVFVAACSSRLYFILYSSTTGGEYNPDFGGLEKTIECRQLLTNKINGSVVMLLSKTHPNCLFIKVQYYQAEDRERGEMVHLLDYERSRIRRTFRLFPCKTIYGVESFLDSSGNEVIVMGGRDKTLSFFNTSPDFLPKLKLISFPYKTISVENWIYSFKVLENRYLFLGDNWGFVHLFDTASINTPRMSKKKVHDQGINQMEYFETDDKYVLITGSNDKSVGVVWISNNFMTSEQALFDIKERVNYLFFDFKDMEEEDLAKIQFFDRSLLLMFKSLIFL